MDDYVRSAVFEKQKPLCLKRARRTAKSTNDAASAKQTAKATTDVLTDVGNRFNFRKEGSYSNMSVPLVPRNTKKNNNWSLKNLSTPQQLLLPCCLGCCDMFVLRIPTLPILWILINHHKQIFSRITRERGWSRGKHTSVISREEENMLWEKGCAWS